MVESQALWLACQPLLAWPAAASWDAEAYLRSEDPERSEVPSSLVVPTVEDCGLVEGLGGCMVKTAAQQLRVWHNAGHTGRIPAVNLSARRFLRGGVRHRVDEALVVFCIAPRPAGTGVDRDGAAARWDAVVAALRQLEALGTKLSMDDCGTNSSMLAYLHRFQSDKVRIDCSFVCDLLDEPHHPATVRGSFSWAHSPGLSVQADGAEAGACAHRLRHLQCTFARGCLFDRPLRPESFGVRIGASQMPLRRPGSRGPACP